MVEAPARQKYKRIAIVAVLGGVLAFASSYLVSPTYVSSTRLIIHGQDPNFLSNTGDSSGGASITDPTSAKALADTYGSIATSRSLAIAVVDKLDLDKKDDGSGPLHWVAGAFAATYRCTRAFITSGFCSSPSRRETAIALVQSTIAAQLGANAGDSAGQPGSYVLEITSNGDSGRQAQQIADAVADQLVIASSQQATTSATQHIALLEKQFVLAKASLTRQIAAISKFQLDNFSTGTGGTKNSSNGTYDQLSAQLNAANSDLADAQAQRVSIDSSLASERPANDTNPAYVTLTTQRTTLDASISGLQARISLLQTQIVPVAPATASANLARLGILQAQLDSTRNNLTALVAGIQQARTVSATIQPDLTRIDTAGRAQYPIAPMRYLYLVIGLLLGGLAGGGLTWLELRRLATGAAVPAGTAPAAGPEPDPIVPTRTREFASAVNGANGATPQHANGTAAQHANGANGVAPERSGSPVALAERADDAGSSGPIERYVDDPAGHDAGGSDSLFDQFAAPAPQDVPDDGSSASDRRAGAPANGPRQETRASRRARQRGSSGRRE